MEWAYLSLAIVFEIFGTTCIKLSEGFTRVAPSALIVPAYVVSFLMLTLAVRVIPISIAYAIWSGIGTAAIAVIGILVFKEPLTLAKAAFLAVIIVGAVGLHLTDRFGGGS
jgi:small multidrug resistance pump